MNVTVESLERKFKGEGEQRFREIAELGGWVVNQSSVTRRDLEVPDGLDLTGALDPDNKEVSEAKKDKIRELAGIEPKTVKKEK